MSSAHQKQDFQVELLPNINLDPMVLDVGATSSPCVTVLSKRNIKKAGVCASHCSSSSSGAGRRKQRSKVPDSGSASHQTFHQSTTDSRAAAEGPARVAAAQAAGAVPSLGLPHRPQGGAGVQGSMQNVMGQIRSMQAAIKAQHDAFQSALATYAARIESDLQTLVADIDSSSAPSNNHHSSSSSSSTVEPMPPPLPRGFGDIPAPPPQLPTKEDSDGHSSRSTPTMRQTSSTSFSIHGDVEADLHSAPYARANSGASEAEDSAAEQSIAYIVAKVIL